MLVLGIDLETGGSFEAPLEDNFITEVGAVLWDTESNMPVRMMNSLVYGKIPISEEATEYTGITNGLVARHGKHISEVIAELKPLWDVSNYVLAHNGLKFDQPILNEVMPTKGRLWIDSMVDVPYPNNCKMRNLTYVAGFHKVLNCFQHRAITDVLTMFEVVSKYDWEEVIRNAESPLVRARAVMGTPNWRNETSMAAFNAEEELVKKAGFRWDPEAKTWELETREIFIGQRSQDWDFKWKIIQGEKP